MNTPNTQKSIALINDISGFGRCSMTVALPIISTLGVQCCPLPTSIFSNHTGFPTYYFEDFTQHMLPYMQAWEALDLHFSGISTGFLGSAEQIEMVQHFFERFKEKDTITIIDPVMGDHGKAYVTYTEDMCRRMKELIRYADILTPNLTEACILTGTPYKEHWRTAEVIQMAEALSAQGPARVVITGIPQKSLVCNLCYERGQQPVLIRTHRIGTERSGTGDIFAAILSADAVNEVPFCDSVRKASQFIRRCIQRSLEQNIPTPNGVCFEQLLHTLR